MRNGNVLIQFWIPEFERDALDERVKKSGLSRSAYLRHLIKNLVPTDQPPPDYFNMMRVLNHIGNNLNQVAQKAHTLNVIDALRYEYSVMALDRAIVEITNAVMLPRKIE